ncbi:MAG: hypothetical protein M3069_23340 [Chloroflexota bacterium]|nr:hypothetical protein [Chloroflexota bacterium]
MTTVDRAAELTARHAHYLHPAAQPPRPSARGVQHIAMPVEPLLTMDGRGLGG